MPITREAFQVGNPGDEDDLAEQFGDVPDADKVASIAHPSGIVDSQNTESAEGSKDESVSRIIGDTRGKESPQAIRKEGSTSLPAADTTSAESREAVGAAHPQREARRSVATGRDVPQFASRPQEGERMEFNWDEA